MKKAIFLTLTLALSLCGWTPLQAQIMKPADLEKYAKSRYGDKWLEAAYSNAILDKIEEALKNGIVGNEDDEW